MTDVRVQALLLQSVDRLVMQFVCYFRVTLHGCAVNGNSRIVMGLLVRAFYLGKDMGTGYPPWVVGMGTYGYG